MNAPRFDRRQLLRLLGIGASSFAAAPLLSSCAVNPATGSSRRSSSPVTTARSATRG